MNIEEEFHQEMLAIYQNAGEELGYWAKRYLQAVKRHGGLEWARKTLQPRKEGDIHDGLQQLLDAGRPDLTVEALALNSRYSQLFEQSHLDEARNRLSVFPSPVIISEMVPWCMEMAPRS